MNSNKKILEKVIEFERNNGLDMYEIRKLLEDNVREDAVKKSKRGKSELSIVKGLYKDNLYKTRKELLNKTMMTGEFFTYMSSVRVYYTRTDLGYEVVDNPFSMAETFVNTFADFDNVETNVELEIDIENLQTFIELYGKEKKPYVIRFTKDNKEYFVGVNPNFLMDSIKFTNNRVIKVPLKSNSFGHINAPIYNAEVDETGLLQKLVVTLPISLCSPQNEDFVANYSYSL